MKRKNDNRFFLLMGTIFLCLFLGVAYIILREINGRGTRVLLISLFGMVGVLAVVWAVHLRRRIVRLTDSVCVVLDQMMSGKEEIVFSDFGDTMPEKLSGKLHQFYAMTQNSREKTERSEQEIRGIVADISHQVKTPIANVKMFTGILKDREMTQEKQKQFLTHMEGQVDKLAFLMEALIKMSRLEIGIIAPNMKCQRLADTVAAALGNVWLKAEQKQIEIEVSGDAGLEVEHDRKWTAEAVFNVLDNAVKYSEEGTSIQIHLSRGEFYTKLDIKDQGIGIQEKHFSDIFRRFYREEGVAEQEGIGLGLHLAREIMTLQKGYISVKSNVGEGSVFSFHFLNEMPDGTEK